MQWICDGYIGSSQALYISHFKLFVGLAYWALLNATERVVKTMGEACQCRLLSNIRRTQTLNIDVSRVRLAVVFAQSTEARC